MTIRRLCGRLAAPLVVGALLFTVVAHTVSADEQGVEQRVDGLVPRLLSDEPAIRARAEGELFGLGDEARQILERMAQEDDVSRSDLALRLLNSDRWPRVDGPGAGEQRATRIDESASPARAGQAPLPGARGDLRAELDALRRRLDELLRDRPRFPDLPRLGPLFTEQLQRDIAGLGERFPGWGRHSASGSVLRDGHRTEWTIDADGRVRVTERDAAGGSRVYEADSVDAFRRAYPEVAGRLDAALPGWGTDTVRVEMPEFRLALPDDLDLRLPGHRRPRLDPTPAPSADRPILGIEWDVPSAALRSHLRLDDGGLLVTHVASGSRAEHLGLREHDVILTLDGKPVRVGPDVTRVLQEAGDRVLTAEIVRAGERRPLSE